MVERQAPEVPDQDSMLALLRTKGLSIRNLDEERKTALRDFMTLLHNERGMSLSDIAKLIGNKTSGYTSWVCKQLGVQARPFEEARLKGIREKRRKYERRPFDGTEEDRAYLMGLREGDISALRPFNNAVRVSTSTTHPKMVELFRSLFEKYGHIYLHPRFKEDTTTYEWNVSAVLDSSFDFLLPRFPDVTRSITSESTLRAYLAGLFDAEGTVGIYPAKKLTALHVAFYNTNLDLLHFVFKSVSELGFRPIPPYLDKKKGFRSPGYHIEMKKDYWRVLLARFEESKNFLRSLPVRHKEKTDLKDLALQLTPGQQWSSVEPRVRALRSSIKAARDSYVAEAERSYLARPHKKLARKPSTQDVS